MHYVGNLLQFSKIDLHFGPFSQKNFDDVIIFLRRHRKDAKSYVINFVFDHNENNLPDWIKDENMSDKKIESFCSKKILTLSIPATIFGLLSYVT